PRVLDRLGTLILTLLAWVGDVALFGGRALYEALLPPYEFKETWRHVFEIGWRSLPLIALSGFAIGVVLSMHTRASLERFVAEASISGMSAQLYFHRAFSIVEFSDFIPATIKTAVFGFVIGTVSSYLGFNTTRGTEGVGRTSTSSVVASSICIILINV